MVKSRRLYCQVKMHDGDPCGRPLIDNNSCIFHSSRPDKDKELFLQELAAIFGNAKLPYYDLTNFVFLSDIFLNIPSTLNKDIILKQAHIKNDFSLENTFFNGKVNFQRTQFEGKAKFQNVQFSKEVDFYGARFEGNLTFTKILFNELTNFCESIFRKDIIFMESIFSADTLFTRSFSQAKVSFEKSIFSENTVFHKTRFNELTIKESSFKKDADFHDSLFSGKVLFANNQFRNEANFDDSEFEDATSFLYCNFKKIATFRRAIYKGDLLFGNTTFNKQAFFSLSRFFGDVSFRYCDFWGGSTFLMSEFHSFSRFIHAVFHNEVGFNRCWFTENGALLIDADEPEIYGVFKFGANFSNMVIDNPSNLIFRKISLEKCRFSETDISKAKFVDVKWDSVKRWRVGKFGLANKMAVNDEIDPDSHWLWWNDLNEIDKSIEKEPQKFQFPLIAQVYRRLQANYVDNYRYSEAGEFFIGEQEMIRKSKGKFRQFFCTDYFYKIFSLYGESFVLPLIWLLICLLIFPMFFLFSGINLSNSLQDQTFRSIADFDWSWNPANFLPFKGEYWEAFMINISFLTFNRAEINARLNDIGQRFIVNIEILLVIVFVTFFLLALRRRFKRKSF